MNTINETDRASVQVYIEHNKGKDYIEGQLLIKEDKGEQRYNKATVLAYLKELGLIGKLTFRARLHAKLSTEYVTTEWFNAEIKKVGGNTLLHRKVYDNERVLGNKIHCIYDQHSRDLMELESGEKSVEVKKPAPKKPAAKKRVSK